MFFFYLIFKGLKEDMNVILEKINNESERVADDLGLELNKKLKLENNSLYGYHFRIPRAVNTLKIIKVL